MIFLGLEGGLVTSRPWPVFDVTHYGAVGDYRHDTNTGTDNLVAINATITACKAAGGGVIQFPLGSFLSSNDVVINASNITVIGPGELVTNDPTGWGAALVMAGAEYPYGGPGTIDNVHVHGLKVTARGSGDLDNAIALVNATNCSVRRCTANADRFAITAQENVTDCVIADNLVTRAKHGGIFIAGLADGADVERISIERNTVTGVVAADGGPGYGIVGAFFDDLAVCDNRVVESAGRGMFFYGSGASKSTRLRLGRNTVRGATQVSVYVLHVDDVQGNSASIGCSAGPHILSCSDVAVFFDIDATGATGQSFVGDAITGMADIALRVRNHTHGGNVIGLSSLTPDHTLRLAVKAGTYSRVLANAGTFNISGRVASGASGAFGGSTVVRSLGLMVDGVIQP